MSYTTFRYGDIRTDKNKITPEGTVEVAVDIMNTGDREGTEVVQLYIRDVYSSPTRPVRELKDFARVNLAPGERRTVTFKVTPEKLSYYNRVMKKVVEPGEFEIMVGSSSADSDLKKVKIEVL